MGILHLRLVLGGLLLAVLAAACSSTGFNIPPVTGGTAGNTLAGKVLWHDLLTDTPEQTRTFYRRLFGWEFKPLAGGDVNYELIYHQGVAIGGLVDQNRLPNQADVSQWVLHLSVADADEAAAAVAGAGGTVLTPPTSLGDRGRIVVIQDSQGALLSLLESGGDPLDGDADPVAGRFLWDELWTVDIDGAVDFYQALAPFVVSDAPDEGVEFEVDMRVLSAEGRPRASIRGRPVETLNPRWVNYLMVESEAALEGILAQVAALGGEVLVASTPRPRGGHVALITGPSGAGIALQTWTDGMIDGSEGEK